MHLKVAIALLSAGAIAYEILLIRIFSIIQWHHFAAMTISLALLGYGISGTVLTLLQGWFAARSPRRWLASFITASVLFGLLSLACAVLAQRIPFNPLAVVWDPMQFLNLLGLYLLLTIPFFFAGTAIGVALMSRPHAIGGLYGADLVGAGVGAAALLGALFVLPVSICLQIVGTLGCVAAGVVVVGHRREPTIGRSAVPVLTGLAIVILCPQSWLDLHYSQYKALHKALLVPEARIVAQRSSPLGLLTVVSSPGIPFRHAPGLSLDYQGSLPNQLGLFTDGDSMTVIDEMAPGDPSAEYLDHLPAALPYWVLTRPRVLILGAAGGSEIIMALQHGASTIDVVEPNSQLLELLAGLTPRPAEGPLGGAAVTFHVAEARSFLRQNAPLFDLIQIPLAQSLAAATAGAQSLGASHLFTVESFVELLRALGPEGVLVVNQWMRIPPRENLKLVAALVEALSAIGVEDPGPHLAQVRGWGTVTTLVKRSPLLASEISRIVRFSQERSFDLSSLPELTEDRSNTYNQLAEAYLFLGNREILKRSDSFFEDYKFDVRPATDDRPFFFHTFKWRTLPELLRLGSRAGAPLVEWGYLILVATVLQSLVAAVVLILLPLGWVRRPSVGPGRAGVVVFFAGLGLGFMLLEIASFERFTLYLGHPTYSVAVVLAAFLVFAGLGSASSRRFLVRGGRWRPTPRTVSILILGLGSLYLIGLPGLLRASIALPLSCKVGFTVAILAPLGFLLGMPFPLGLAQAADRSSVLVPWAWGINGSASVVGAAAAPLIALHLGYSAVILAGLVSYSLAASCRFAGLPIVGVKESKEE